MNRNSMSRSYFFATGVFVVAGIIIELFVSADRQGGYFHSPLAKALNLFAYFTIQSNIVVGITSFLLATKKRLTGNIFWGFRLSGLAAIIVTFIIQHLFLSGHTPAGWPQVGDTIVHTIVPVMTLLGWLVFGPRGHVSRRIIAVSMIFPVAWLAFTFIRGKIIHWYPYDFVDVGKHGGVRVAINVLAITVVFLVIAFAAKLYDGKFSKHPA